MRMHKSKLVRYGTFLDFLVRHMNLHIYEPQRGAVQPLIRMLEASDPQLREMAAFALGRLAQVLIAVALFSALIENLVFLSLQSAKIITLLIVLGFLGGQIKIPAASFVERGVQTFILLELH